MLRNFGAIIFLLVIIKSSAYPLVNSISDCYMQSPYEVELFLTISSLYASTTEEGIVQRPLEVNWVGKPTDGSIIGIYNIDPDRHPTAKPIRSFNPLEHPGGYFRSDVIIPIQFFNRSSILTDDHCLGYWSAYHDKNGDIVTSKCLEIRPFWMERISEHLYNKKLNHVMIPGSHDSGSFYIHREIEPLSKYMYAQEESIFNQLVYGLRYFDLRVGYYPKSHDKYYINHNFLKTDHSVKSVLHQVLKFIKSTKKEIVILDFHNFPIGFNNKLIHMDLLHLISKTFGSYLVPHKENLIPTFSQMWKNGKRVLVSYDNDIREMFYSKTMWPSIPRAWGNKQHPDELKAYFKDVFSKPMPKGLWAAMAELTPNTKTIVLHPETGLRVFADQVNKNVTHWFRDIYWQKANIVATDYFLGNDIIDVAIRTNKVKGICPENSWNKLKP